MGRALALLLFLPLAWGQTLNCDATGLTYDFSAPGPLQTLTVGGQPYYVANLASYLLLLEGTAPLRFLPTAVAGGTGYRVACTVITPAGGGGGGTLCGAGTTRCLRVSGVSGSLPVDWTGRLYVMAQVISGNATSHAPVPTLLSAVPDNRGLASVARNTTALIHIYYWVEFSPNDTFATLPATGILTLTYRIQGN
jgi:hypothetical protein